MNTGKRPMNHHQGAHPTVLSVNISREKGTCKRPVQNIELTERGIVSDAHAGQWHRQVSLLSKEIIDTFAHDVGRNFAPGEFAENITTLGLDLSELCLFDELTIGESLLEVTQIGKSCHPDGCTVAKQVGKCVMPREGIFCRVKLGGTIAPGDAIHLHPRNLLFRVLTLSDRASQGDYEDRSGPRISAILNDFFGPRRWRQEVVNYLLPDDPKRLRALLQQAREDGVDVVITTGGTGVGPRDITPDVVVPLCDKLLPGIMDYIRLKFGAAKPTALLSRSVAGIMGSTIVYSLPGSVHAVEEYLGEILKTLEHLILTVHGIDPHAY